MIERAMKMGSVLLEAGKRSARKRATMHNAVIWACLLISLPKYVCIEFFFCWGFGFRLFVRWEYTKLFDGLPGTLDMGSIIVIKKFDVWPGLVRVDYMSCRVDLAALKGGKYVELVNLVPWKGVELQLKHVHAVGVYGWGSVCETIIGEWLEDISQNQVHKPLDIPTGASESILATRASEIS